MRKIFYPESLVVLGVSPRAENLGKNIIANLLEFGYRGRSTRSEGSGVRSSGSRSLVRSRSYQKA
jgi:acyl-CoA synthetase (NDP forming)